MRQTLFQLARYVITGVASMLVDLGCLQVLLAAGLSQALAVALAFLAGVALNFVMHKFFTFRDPAPMNAGQAGRFAAVVALNLGLTEAIVWGATALLPVGPFAGKLASLPVVLIVGYTLSRRWIFARRA